MAQRKFILQDDRGNQDLRFVYVSAGYLVENNKVLLGHHKGWNKWVPPGGHLEPGDTFSQSAKREFEEETGLKVEVISSQPVINPNDDMAVPLPVPFYVDLENDFKPTPAIVQFYWVRRLDESMGKKHVVQKEELHAIDWFDAIQLKNLNTFEQVRRVALFALDNHPDSLL